MLGDPFEKHGLAAADSRAEPEIREAARLDEVVDLRPGRNAHLSI